MFFSCLHAQAKKRKVEWKWSKRLLLSHHIDLHCNALTLCKEYKLEITFFCEHVPSENDITFIWKYNFPFQTELKPPPVNLWSLWQKDVGNNGWRRRSDNWEDRQDVESLPSLRPRPPPPPCLPPPLTWCSPTLPQIPQVRLLFWLLSNLYLRIFSFCQVFLYLSFFSVFLPFPPSFLFKPR